MLFIASLMAIFFAVPALLVLSTYEILTRDSVFGLFTILALIIII